jgi:hypothetical protein
VSHELRRNADSLTIPARFNGPPGSGNGGYVGGEMARAVDRLKAGSLASGVCVRLLRPSPLETSLEIAEIDGGYGLFDGDEPVAQATERALDLEVPDPVPLEVAREAARSFRGFDAHVFRECFVCGPSREVGDGLRIFSGALPAGAAASQPGVFAAPWQPDVSLEDPEQPGIVEPAFVWAALDCPGSFSFPQPVGAIVLLGEMTAALFGSVRVDEPSVLLSWEIEHSGRKHKTGSAVYDARGKCQGAALAVWIEVSES